MDRSSLGPALDPPRFHGAPLGGGVLRAQPEDFIVEEELGFAPSGVGQHILVKVRKRNANTQWVARELAKACGCRPLDIGYAGLKDRRAVAIQWFSVPQSQLTVDACRALSGDEFEVLETHAHSRKLPRGALAANRFTIRIREFDAHDSDLVARIAEITRRGVPNYFGPQRFGRNGSNLERIGAGSRRLHGPERGFVLSAARSLVFNAVLAERVRDGSWDRLQPGDVANLDGRGSVFPIDALDETLIARCERLDIHPTGPLWGRGMPVVRGRVLELETRVADGYAEACSLTADAGMDHERRSLRLAVRDLAYEREPSALVVRFRLTKGSFATMVLREIVESDGADEGGEGDS